MGSAKAVFEGWYMLQFCAADIRTGSVRRHSDSGTAGFTYSTGEECPNYILSKNAGRHQNSAAGAADLSATFEMDYSGLQAVSKDTGHVIVSVRNRWYHAGVTLQAAVKEIKKEVPSINTIYGMFCRVKDGHDNWAWDAGSARTGGWSQV